MLKKSLLLICVMASLATNLSFAQERHPTHEEYGRRPHPDAVWHEGRGWLLPAIVGGALVYGAMSAQQAAPQPMPVAPAPYPIQPQQPPYGYHWEQFFDQSCNCYRVALVRN